MSTSFEGTVVLRVFSDKNLSMNAEAFLKSLDGAVPPEVRPALVALWWDGKGNWENAHAVAQDIADREGSWVHAYLHRKEGDLGNADYWYERAGRTRPEVSLADEWKQVVREMLKQAP